MDRRTGPGKPPGRTRGRRWADDPDLSQHFERLRLSVSRDLYGLREGLGWSQEEAAKAAGVDPQTVLDIEKTRADPHLSTVMRLYFVYGRQLVVAGLPIPSPDSSRANPDGAAAS